MGAVEGTWPGLRVRTCHPGRCIGVTENGMSTVEYSIVIDYNLRASAGKVPVAEITAP